MCYKNSMSLNEVISYLPIIVIFLVSLTIHEFAHGYTAYIFGDDTAKRMGRLTLNPIAHVSLLGTVIMPLIAKFGWAKPVPVNFSVLNRIQILLVALAGPLSNILLACVLAVAYHVLPVILIQRFGNFILLAILFNLILAVFNLIPIPPLDGSRIVYSLIKNKQVLSIYSNISTFGMFIVVGFLLIGGFERIILPAVGFLYRLSNLPVPVL